jgi:AraC-like DNA-binding protein
MNAAEVNSAALVGWANKAADFGVNTQAALAVVGVGNAFRACDRDRISLAEFTRMAEFVGEHSSNQAASWLIGEDYDLTALGEIGAAVLSAKTLGGALRRFADSFELLQDSSRLALNVSADTATLSYRILDPSIWPRYQDALFSLGIVTKIIKMAAPDALDHAELEFECGRRETGLKLAQSQLAFGCEANSIRLPSLMLDAPMPVTPILDQGGLRALAVWIAERRRGKLARERLAEIIFARLPDGDISQDQLSSEIGMSSRTMRRRLADESTSFQQLLDECRMRQAVLEFRIRPEASIAEIALRLGYAEHSTFTRAFTRWAGTPPQRFRTEMNVTEH